MTTTNVLTTQSVGTSTNVGNTILPQKVTAQSTSSGFFINLKLTNGAAGYPANLSLRCWFTTSSFSLTAAQAALAMQNQARYVDLPLSINAADVRTALSELTVLAGSYIYFWFDIPALTVAATLAADCVEV